MHDDRHGQPARKLRSRGEMIRVGVRVDQVADMQTIARSQPEVAIQLADFGVDEHCRARVRTSHQIRLAAACRDVLEDHVSPWKTLGPQDAEVNTWDRLLSDFADRATKIAQCVRRTAPRCWAPLSV